MEVVPGRTLRLVGTDWHWASGKAHPEASTLLVGAGMSSFAPCNWSLGCGGAVVVYVLARLYTTAGLGW